MFDLYQRLRELTSPETKLFQMIRDILNINPSILLERTQTKTEFMFSSVDLLIEELRSTIDKYISGEAPAKLDSGSFIISVPEYFVNVDKRAVVDYEKAVEDLKYLSPQLVFIYYQLEEKVSSISMLTENEDELNLFRQKKRVEDLLKELKIFNDALNNLSEEINGLTETTKDT